ncbi:unnamed protein product, partial [marine sediment metagenome]
HIIINPGFGLVNKYKYPSRLWPLERYAQIIDYVIEKYNLQVLLTGNHDEKVLSNKIKDLTKNKDKIIVCCGEFSLREFMALIDSAELVIEPSTGAGHVASALKTPVIDLIGRGDPSEWRPWGKKDKTLYFFHSEVCTSCSRGECRKKNIECLKAITAEEVKSAIDKLISIGK